MEREEIEIKPGVLLKKESDTGRQKLDVEAWLTQRDFSEKDEDPVCKI